MLESEATIVKGGRLVTQVSPWHSKRVTDRNVYHDNNKCTEGNNIESWNRESGTDGRPKCEHCADLDAKGQ
jgi:hypothetical protein